MLFAQSIGDTAIAEQRPRSSRSSHKSQLVIEAMLVVTAWAILLTLARMR